MLTKDQALSEIAALVRLADTVPDDALAKASIAGQINVLSWVMGMEEPLASLVWKEEI